MLLGILDKATLTLGDNRRVDLSQCIITFDFESGREVKMTNLVDGGFGFSPKAVEVDEKFDDRDSTNGGGRGAAQVYAGVHEPHRQDGGIQDAAR